MLAEGIRRGRWGEKDQTGSDVRGLEAQVSRAAQELMSWRRNVARQGLPAGLGKGDATQAMVAGFPDRVGAIKQSGVERVSWSGGGTAKLHKGSTCRAVGPLLALDLEEREAAKGDEANRERVIRWAMPVGEGALAGLYPGAIKEEITPVYREDRELVERLRQRKYRDVVVWERVERGGAESSGLLAELIQSGKIHLEAWEEEADPWLARARCVAAWFPERGLLTYNTDELHLVLLEYCEGATRVSQLKERSLLQAMKNVLSPSDSSFIERMAPLRLDLPSGAQAAAEVLVGGAAHRPCSNSGPIRRGRNPAGGGGTGSGAGGDSGAEQSTGSSDRGSGRILEDALSGDSPGAEPSVSETRMEIGTWGLL